MKYKRCSLCHDMFMGWISGGPPDPPPHVEGEGPRCDGCGWPLEPDQDAAKRSRRKKRLKRIRSAASVIITLLCVMAAHAQTCAYTLVKPPVGVVQVYQNGTLLTQGPDYIYDITATPIVTPAHFRAGDAFSVIFSRKFWLSLTVPGVATPIPYQTYRNWQESWTCTDSNMLPAEDKTITVESGTMTAGAELVGAVPTLEVPIMTNIPGTRRFALVTVCSTVRFLGQTRLQVGIGRPGTNHVELTGVSVPLLNASNNSNCWTTHPSIPQLTGPYDLVAFFEVFSVDANNVEIPGSFDALSDGQMTWEIAYYTGKIGNVLGSVGQLDKVNVLQCSGSLSHVDPFTGKTWVSDCAGLKWVQTANSSVVGVDMTPAPVQGINWAPRQP